MGDYEAARNVADWRVVLTTLMSLRHLQFLIVNHDLGDDGLAVTASGLSLVT